MSGELVGEVLAARRGPLADLGPTHLLALIAIASRCDTDRRRGWCTYAEMMSVVGCSQRTAQRLIGELRDRGLIEVVARGYKAPGQQPRAPVYRLAEFPPPMAEAHAEFPPPMAEAHAEFPPPMAEAHAEFPPNPAELPPNQGRAPATQHGHPTSLPTSLLNERSAPYVRNARATPNVAARNGHNPRARAEKLLRECVLSKIRVEGITAEILTAILEDAVREHLPDDQIRREIDGWLSGFDGETKLLADTLELRLKEAAARGGDP